MAIGRSPSGHDANVSNHCIVDRFEIHRVVGRVLEDYILNENIGCLVHPEQPGAALDEFEKSHDWNAPIVGTPSINQSSLGTGDSNVFGLVNQDTGGWVIDSFDGWALKAQRSVNYQLHVFQVVGVDSIEKVKQFVEHNRVVRGVVLQHLAEAFGIGLAGGV